MGESRPDVAEELTGKSGLVVASKPPETTEPAGTPAYCCPVEAPNDETDGPAVFKRPSRTEQVRLSRAVCGVECILCASYGLNTCDTLDRLSMFCLMYLTYIAYVLVVVESSDSKSSSPKDGQRSSHSEIYGCGTEPC